MSKRLLMIGLGVSLLFNLAVLIGFVKSRVDERQSPTGEPQQMPPHPPVGDPPLQRLVKELRLDNQQMAVVDDLQKRQREQAALFGDSMSVVRQSMADELRKPQPDLDRLRALLDQEAEVLRQRRMAEADLFGEFMNVLSPEQRQNLNRLRDRGPHQGARPSGRPGDPGKRFDRNRNGHLEPEEQQLARRELENVRRRVAPHAPPRPPLWPWFDGDGDGELNDAERAEMEQFMRDHRPAVPQRDRQGQTPPQIP